MSGFLTKRKKKQILARRNTEKGRPGESLVSYCPVCPRMVNPSDPEKDAHEVVDMNTRTATCSRCGHKWTVR